MKPYRGTLLAVVVLLATLPLFGCGDADNFAESGKITLTSDIASVDVKKEVVFTVVADPKVPTAIAQAKVILDECDMSLQYMSNGAGIDQNWSEIPGTSATRSFTLQPRVISPLSVTARGKCLGSNEQWEYSNQVVVTVNDKTLPKVTTVELAANPTSVAMNKPVTFTLNATTAFGASSSEKCTLNLRYQYSGAGFSGVTTVYPAFIGQFILTPTAAGELTVTATGWCSENIDAPVSTTTKVTVTAVALPRVTSVILTASPDPYTVVSGTGIDFNLSATVDALCTPTFSYTYLGGGISGTVPSVSAGIFNLKPNNASLGPLVVTVTAWCTQNPTATVPASKSVPLL